MHVSKCLKGHTSSGRFHHAGIRPAKEVSAQLKRCGREGETNLVVIQRFSDCSYTTTYFDTEAEARNHLTEFAEAEASSLTEYAELV